MIGNICGRFNRSESNRSFDPTSTPRVLGFQGNGRITLDQSSIEVGAAVVGDFEGEFIQIAEP